MRNITYRQIVEILKELEINSGDTVLVHCSLSSIGRVEGDADTVIDAFIEAVGGEGTIVMPAFTDNLKEPFDLESTKSDTGIITEIFRKRKSVLRSMHPTHSVCAYGKFAEKIVEGHNLSDTPCGRRTPFYKIKELNGKIVLLGVDMSRNTMLHAVEEETGMKYLIEEIKLPAPTYIDDYENKTLTVRKFPAGHRDFLKLTPVLRENHLMREAFVGSALTKVFESEKFFDFAAAILKTNPGFFLCNNDCCNSCVAANLKIRGLSFDDRSFNNRCKWDNCEVCVI